MNDDHSDHPDPPNRKGDRIDVGPAGDPPTPPGYDALTAEAMAMVRALRRLIVSSDRYRTASAAAVGLNVTDTYALSNLNLTGPLTQTELAARLGITRSATTVLIDRLEAANLAKRTPHPTDRRTTLVDLTEPAHHLLKEAAARLATVLPNTTPTHAQEIANLLGAIADRMDDLARTPLGDAQQDWHANQAAGVPSDTECSGLD